MLEVEDWTQPGASKRRQNSKKASVAVDPREDPPVTLSVPPEDEVEETFHPTRAPNSKHFPAARSGTNSTAPVAGPSSLSRILAQAPATSEPALPETVLLAPISGPSPLRTPSPPPPPVSSSPAQSSSYATAVAGRPHPPHPSSPLRPGSRASSRYSAPRLPVFGGAGGSATKAVPTTAITAPPVLEEPSTTGAGALGPILTTMATTVPPLPSGTSGEGMASLLGRRRTTSFHVPPSSSPLAAPTPRQTAAGPAAALATLANWGSPFSRRRRADAASESSVPSAPASTVAGQTDAQRILQKF
jgi:autophagy-related protein 11